MFAVLLMAAMYGLPVVALVMEIVMHEELKDGAIRSPHHVAHRYRWITLAWSIAWMVAVLI
jgi:hypothetical protein